jgi:hypothetical protein
MNPPIKRRRGAPAGALLILLGLWGGLVPFVGPYFNYQIGTTSTWDWSSDRLLLSVLPAAAAVLGGLILLAGGRRLSASFGALLALAGGLWFIGGPVVSELWNNGTLATGQALGSDTRRVLEWIGFYYGTGAAITLLSSYALGFLAALPIREEVATPVADERTAARPTPTRRRRFRRGSARARDTVGSTR